MNNNITINLSSKLIEISNIKQNIRTAITNKGLDMTNVPFNQYSEKIDLISVSGNEQSGTLFPIYQQENEPNNKEGLWIKTDTPIQNTYIANTKMPSEGEYVQLDSIDSAIVPNFTNCVSIGKDVYLINSSSNLFYKYNLETKTITQLQNTPVYFDCCTAINSYIYCCKINEKNFYRYSTLADLWTKLADCPNNLGFNENAVSGFTKAPIDENKLIIDVITYKTTTSGSTIRWGSAAIYLYDWEENLYTQTLAHSLPHRVEILGNKMYISNRPGLAYDNVLASDGVYNLETWSKETSNYISMFNGFNTSYNHTMTTGKTVAIDFYDNPFIWTPYASQSGNYFNSLAFLQYRFFVNNYSYSVIDSVNQSNLNITNDIKLDSASGSRVTLYENNSVLFFPLRGNQHTVWKWRPNFKNYGDGIYLFFNYSSKDENPGYEINDTYKYISKVWLYQNNERKHYNVYIGNGVTWERLFE